MQSGSHSCDALDVIVRETRMEICALWVRCVQENCSKDSEFSELKVNNRVWACIIHDANKGLVQWHDRTRESDVIPHIRHVSDVDLQRSLRSLTESV